LALVVTGRIKAISSPILRMARHNATKGKRPEALDVEEDEPLPLQGLCPSVEPFGPLILHGKFERATVSHTIWLNAKY
jgi:hypothetical protein